MVYIIGFIGFIFGFIAGQGLLMVLLKHRSQEDLLENKQLRFTYGLLNWAVACIGAYMLSFFYSYYFGS